MVRKRLKNRPATVDPNRSYGPLDEILIESVDAAGKPAGTSMNLVVKRYQGDLKKKTRPENYPVRPSSSSGTFPSSLSISS